jgi:hypothetical protein
MVECGAWVRGVPLRMHATREIKRREKKKAGGNRLSQLLDFDFNGRGERIRTSDPLHPMQVRYQAALRPDEPRIIAETLTVFSRVCAETQDMPAKY